MSVAGLGIDASNRNPIVLLRDPSGRRQVPIWIDHAQAHNILNGSQKSNPQKPLSHDLMISLMRAGNIQLDHVIINALGLDTFQAILKIRPSSTDNCSLPLLEIVARPSDAIALAVRTSSSIWMMEEIVASASIPVDAEADEEDQTQFRHFIEKVSPAELVRHLETRNKDIRSPFDSTDPES